MRKIPCCKTIETMPCLLQTTSNLEKYKKQTLDSRFVSKYEGRRNGGIPCFSEERSIERAAKVTGIPRAQSRIMRLTD